MGREDFLLGAVSSIDRHVYGLAGRVVYIATEAGTGSPLVAVLR